jgi:hypothetical protein
MARERTAPRSRRDKGTAATRAALAADNGANNWQPGENLGVPPRAVVSSSRVQATTGRKWQ